MRYAFEKTTLSETKILRVVGGSVVSESRDIVIITNRWRIEFFVWYLFCMVSNVLY